MDPDGAMEKALSAFSTTPWTAQIGAAHRLHRPDGGYGHRGGTSNDRPRGEIG